MQSIAGQIPEISIVVPLKDEADNLVTLHGEIVSALKSLTTKYEIIFIDDGSTDNSSEILLSIAQSDNNVHVICFATNFGQTAAMSAGFEKARGDLVISMDGDLQNDPKDFGRLIDKLKEGYDLVAGWRKNREDKTLSRIVPSVIANWIIGKVTGICLHDYGCSLKVYKRHVVKNMQLYGEMHRFIPAYAAMQGARIIEIPVNHRPRIHGATKYNLSRTFRVILDVVTVKFLMRFAYRPMHAMGMPGFFILLSGIGLGCYLSVLKLVFKEAIGNRPLLVLAVLLILIGVQFVMLGLLAEMLVRIGSSSTRQMYKIKFEIANGNRLEDFNYSPRLG